MRRAIGPIVTTGAAMVAAGVVVANPILAPSADVRIPAVSLSAGTADSMLDKSFLDAIAPAPIESSGPFSVLKQLVNALAADVTYLGKNAIVDAFVAGVGAVSGPGLGTAPSTNTVVLPPPTPVTPVAPVIAPLPTVSNPIPALVPHVDASVLSSAISTVPVDIASVASSFVNASVAPVVAQFENVVSAIAYDASYVGKNVLTAAFAVGAAVAAEPALIGDTLKALINGDIGGALQNAVKAVVKVVETPISSSFMVINAFKEVIQNRLEELVAMFFPAAGSANLPVPSTETPAPSVTAGTDASVPAPTARHPRSSDPVVLSGSRTRAGASPAAALPARSASGSTPRAAAGAVRDAVRGAAQQIGEQIDAAVQNPVGKVARARGAAAAR